MLRKQIWYTRHNTTAPRLILLYEFFSEEDAGEGVEIHIDEKEQIDFFAHCWTIISSS